MVILRFRRGWGIPVYEAQCPECQVRAEYLRGVAECLDTPDCPECGVKMAKKVFSVPHGFMRGKFEPFKSTVDGTIIANHKDMLEHNKRNNVVCMADGYTDEQVKAGTFKKEPVKVDTKKEVASDLMEAAIQVRDGYKPEVRYED